MFKKLIKFHKENEFKYTSKGMNKDIKTGMNMVIFKITIHPIRFLF